MIRHSQRGFTLIEIMVVVAIVGILASIAFPAYNEYSRNSRRTAIQGCLMEQAHFMERWHSGSMTYVGATAAANWPACQGGAANFYNVAPAAAATATTYRLRATPTGDQLGSNSACNTGFLEIDQTGARTPAGCW